MAEGRIRQQDRRGCKPGAAFTWGLAHSFVVRAAIMGCLSRGGLSPVAAIAGHPIRPEISIGRCLMGIAEELVGAVRANTTDRTADPNGLEDHCPNEPA